MRSSNAEQEMLPLKTKSSMRRKKLTDPSELSEEHASEVIEMALSDHVSFAEIELEYGLYEPQVKALMRDRLKPSSYRAWRKRVRKFSDRRAHYK
ncbi:hypothetical protein LAX5112_01788 [Roseibium alexandrii]|uniref:TIGR03643 family protein n=4 Tax=Roseibium TaxID=150830 RepID=A0A0M7A4K8_9HYPH|nr:hypothetical protein LAX5112_01788 [Roseibium alexandrii]